MSLLGQIDLNSLLVFDAVVDSGSFTAASERLGMAKAKVSIQISRLEQAIGATLFHRTTRRVSLTDAGRALHAQCRPLLDGLEQAVEQAGPESVQPAQLTGMLRITSPLDQTVLSVAPALAQFARRHPALQFDLRAGDTVVDLVEEGIDLAIRYGWLRDSSLRAVKLGEFSQYVVASPQYLEQHGRPRRPEDLAGCEWLALSLLPTPLTWKFTSRAGETCPVQVKSRIRVNSPAALRALLREGAGVSVLAQQSAEEGMREGYLVRLLPQWSLPQGGIYAVVPPGRHMPARVRAFIDFYREYLQNN